MKGNESLEDEVQVKSELEMDQLGERIANAVQPGLVIALVGDLGAGKTRLVRAIAIALGADPNLVNSPTFVLVQHYAARLPLFHCDTYRLRDSDEFMDLGAEEFLNGKGVSFVEWADRVEEALPDDLLRIRIESTGLESRRVTMTATGPTSREVLSRIRDE